MYMVSVVHHVPYLNLARERGKKHTCDRIRVCRVYRSIIARNIMLVTYCTLLRYSRPDVGGISTSKSSSTAATWNARGSNSLSLILHS